MTVSELERYHQKMSRALSLSLCEDMSEKSAIAHLNMMIRTGREPAA